MFFRVMTLLSGLSALSVFWFSPDTLRAVWLLCLTIVFLVGMVLEEVRDLARRVEEMSRR